MTATSARKSAESGFAFCVDKSLGKEIIPAIFSQSRQKDLGASENGVNDE